MRFPGTTETKIREMDTLVNEILEQVAAATGTAPDCLPTLYDVMDVESSTRPWSSIDGPSTVVFRYAGCEIRLGGDGTLVATRIDD